jgi:hypothetical protein
MLAYLTGSAVQGGADAFVESEIPTALSGIGNASFRVREILFQFSNIGEVDCDQTIALSRRSKTAMPLVTDRDVLAMVSLVFRITTSGATYTSYIFRQTFTEDDDLRIVEDPLFLQLDSTNTSLTLTGYCRIGYERVNISQVDRLTLLTQSLAE